MGAGAAIILPECFGWNTAVDVFSIFVAFLFTGAVGVLFGVWPARRAAGLNAIEALRYE